MNRLAAAGLLATSVLQRVARAHAADRDPVEFRLETGISAMTSPQQYSLYAEFPGASPIMGVAVELRRPHQEFASLELGFLALGPGVVSGARVPEVTPTVDRSSLLTAMLSFGWNEFSSRGEGPFAS